MGTAVITWQAMLRRDTLQAQAVGFRYPLLLLAALTYRPERPSRYENARLTIYNITSSREESSQSAQGRHKLPQMTNN
jgi:hypothetical protein